ncbi:MAG: 16S rRNA processing protein RimM [Selenomonadaceae bacterium]|nr:16S rRNA processing protein RimM [Selenomonadaceae bacterium]
MTKSSQSEDRIVVGKIGAPHGVRGTFRVYALTDFPERFFEMKEIRAGKETFAIESVKEDNKSLLMKFARVDTREDAALLNGRLLTVDRKDAAPLEEGEYYTFDIVGLNVFDLSGENLGKVTNVLRTGSNDVYVVNDAEGKEILIPALKKVVKAIDIEAGKMVADMSEMEILE